MPSVFTLFCHGTSSHRSDRDKEIVTEFGKLASGQEYRDYLILDGPGARPKGSTPDAQNNPMAGTFDPYTRDKTPKSPQELRDAGFTKNVKNPKFMDMSKPWQWQGTAWGKGWDDNVIHAMATISELDPLPERINMIGWSRGAVTCTKAAFLLQEVYPQIAVNIFAIDPVAGPYNKGLDDTSTIKENVRNYIAVLMMDERRKIMAPQDLSRVTISPKTNATFLPFPGVHDTAVKMHGSAQEVAQVVWSLAYRFLTHFGTRFAPPPSRWCEGREFCNLYGRMIARRTSYKANARKDPGSGAMLGTRDRQFVSSLDKYVVDADYFVNEHHRATFKRTYPNVYDFLFEGRPGLERQAWMEFKEMYKLPGLMKSLEMFGVKEPDPGHPFVLPPPGAGHRRGGFRQLGIGVNLVYKGVF